QHLAIAGDDVNLAVGAAVVAGEDAVAARLELRAGGLFATRAQTQVEGPWRRRGRQAGEWGRRLLSVSRIGGHALPPEANRTDAPLASTRMKRAETGPTASPLYARLRS